MFIISYRREDTQQIVGRIHDQLILQFGHGLVFRDLDSIPVGVDFRSHIENAFKSCLGLIAIIGPDWLGTSPTGGRRIDDTADFVRVEISLALKMNLPIIPVIIDKTVMPSAESLPEDLQSLAFRNAIRVDSGIDFHHHLERLGHSLRSLIAPQPGGAVPPANRSPKAGENAPFSVQPYLGITDAFRNVQKALIKEGLLDDYPDGVVGRKTMKAVQAFQKKFALPESGGGLDQATLDSLFDWESRPESPLNQEDPDLMRRYLRKPSYKRLADQIVWLQKTLRRGGCYEGPTDGVLRLEFLESIREFQISKRTEPDGCIGYETLLLAIEDEVNLRNLGGKSPER